MRHPFILILPQHKSRLFPSVALPHKGLSAASSSLLKVRTATFEPFFFLRPSSGSKQRFFKPEVSPHSDSSCGMMSVVLTPQVLPRWQEQPVRTCLSRGRDAIVPPSPLSCSRILSSPRCELLSVGGRDDGKMFFPTCAMLSSCCGTEIEKHPYFHFLTFF